MLDSNKSAPLSECQSAFQRISVAKSDRAFQWATLAESDGAFQWVTFAESDSAFQWVTFAESDCAFQWVTFAESDCAFQWVTFAESDWLAPQCSHPTIAPHLKRLPSTTHVALRVLQLVLILLTTLLPSTAWSQYSNTEAFVTRSIRGRDVLRVQSTVDSPPGGNTGVIKVSIGAPKPSPADRDLVVVFYLQSYGSAKNTNVAYRVPIRLEEGKSRVELELPYVSFQGQSIWDVGVFEDGRDIEDTRGQTSTMNWTNSNDGPYLGLAALLANGESESTALQELEDLSEHVMSLPVQPRLAGLPIAQVFQVAEASQDWRFYLTRSCWVISPTAIAELNLRPPAAQAVRNYIAAGGFLLVPGTTDAAQLAEVNNLLSGNLLSGTSSNGDGQFWTTDFAMQTGLMDANSTYLENPAAALQDHPILKKFCFGSVLATAEPLKGMNSDYWKITLSSLLRPKPIAFENDGDWFWRNLIRAVGKPPVWVFCGIVTLFGALLGPGLLVFTGRMKRRSLMIFLVPAISLVATLAIVSYGVLHEGFETHVRVTSVQAIEPATQQGFVWSRQNYFSGLPPRDGITFSSQTFAREVAAENDRNNYRYDGNPRRGITSTVNILPDGQNWTGWLRPRQQQQLLVGHTAKSPKLPIEVARSQGRVSLKNTGRTELKLVLLRGERNDYYFTEQLAPGQLAELKGDALDTIRAKVAKVMVDYRPQSPPELGEGGSLLDFGSGSRRYTTQNNFFELEDILNSFFKQRVSDKLEMPPFGFAILTTESDQVEVPLQGTSDENLHLIIGTHAW